MKTEGLIFCRHLEKNVRKLQILSASFEKESEPPIAKACDPKRECGLKMEGLQVANNITLSSDFMNESDLM